MTITPATILKYKSRIKSVDKYGKCLSKGKVYGLVHYQYHDYLIVDDLGEMSYYGEDKFTPCDENGHSLPGSDERIKEYYNSIHPEYQGVGYKMYYDKKNPLGITLEDLREGEPDLVAQVEEDYEEELSEDTIKKFEFINDHEFKRFHENEINKEKKKRDETSKS